MAQSMCQGSTLHCVHAKSSSNCLEIYLSMREWDFIISIELKNALYQQLANIFLICSLQK